MHNKITNNYVTAFVFMYVVSYGTEMITKEVNQIDKLLYFPFIQFFFHEKR